MLQPEIPAEVPRQVNARDDSFESPSTDDDTSPARRALHRRASTQVGHAAHVMEVEFAENVDAQIAEVILALRFDCFGCFVRNNCRMAIGHHVQPAETDEEAPDLGELEASEAAEYADSFAEEDSSAEDGVALATEVDDVDSIQTPLKELTDEVEPSSEPPISTHFFSAGTRDGCSQWGLSVKPSRREYSALQRTILTPRRRTTMQRSTPLQHSWLHKRVRRM